VPFSKDMGILHAGNCCSVGISVAIGKQVSVCAVHAVHVDSAERRGADGNNAMA